MSINCEIIQAVYNYISEVDWNLKTRTDIYTELREELEFAVSRYENLRIKETMLNHGHNSIK